MEECGDIKVALQVCAGNDDTGRICKELADVYYFECAKGSE